MSKKDEFDAVLESVDDFYLRKLEGDTNDEKAEELTDESSPLKSDYDAIKKYLKIKDDEYKKYYLMNIPKNRIVLIREHLLSYFALISNERRTQVMDDVIKEINLCTRVMHGCEEPGELPEIVKNWKKNTPEIPFQESM